MKSPFHKGIAIPILLTGAGLFLWENFFSRRIVKKQEKCGTHGSISIVYNSNNPLQKEIANIISNQLKEDLKVKVNVSMSADNEKVSQKKHEPIVIARNNFLLESLNPYAIKNRHTHDQYTLKNKLRNLFDIIEINDLPHLREEFRWMENPQNSIILLTPETYHKTGEKILSLFRNKRTKILIITDQSLRRYLQMSDDDNKLYLYYPPKTPYKMTDPESYLHTFLPIMDKSSGSPTLEEGLDFNSYYNLNPISLMLRYACFRDEILLDDALIKNFLQSKDGDAFTLVDRILHQKQLCYPNRNVTKLAETNKTLIQAQLSQPGKCYLFIFVPSWNFLKESVFDYIFYQASHLFDGIQVTTSKNFSMKNNLFEDSPLSQDLPQIFLVETNDGVKRTAYSLNFFRFSEDFSSYLKGTKEMFYPSDVIDNLTYVETVNSQNFEDKVIKDTTFKEFVIEVKQEKCPTCYMLGKMFDHISQKFNKHGYLKDFRFFRVDSENDLPYLGEFFSTPTYLFCRKNDKGEIEFISQLDKSEFLYRIKRLSQLDLSKVDIHPNIGYGFILYQKNEFTKPDYDPDIDLAGFKI